MTSASWALTGLVVARLQIKGQGLFDVRHHQSADAVGDLHQVATLVSTGESTARVVESSWRRNPVAAVDELVAHLTAWGSIVEDVIPGGEFSRDELVRQLAEHRAALSALVNVVAPMVASADKLEPGTSRTSPLGRACTRAQATLAGAIWRDETKAGTEGDHG